MGFNGAFSGGGSGGSGAPGPQGPEGPQGEPGPGIPAGERIEGASLFDVTPTALGRFGLSVSGLAGRDLFAGR